MTHDLLRNVIHDLKAPVQKIVVCDLQENTFYALIYLSLNGDTLAIDARPSDAIALALRTRAPIFVEDAVIDHAKTVISRPRRTTPSGSTNGWRASTRTTSANTRCRSRLTRDRSARPVNRRTHDPVTILPLGPYPPA